MFLYQRINNCLKLSTLLFTISSIQHLMWCLNRSLSAIMQRRIAARVSALPRRMLLLLTYTDSNGRLRQQQLFIVLVMSSWIGWLVGCAIHLEYIVSFGHLILCIYVLTLCLQALVSIGITIITACHSALLINGSSTAAHFLVQLNNVR